MRILLIHTIACSVFLFPYLLAAQDTSPIFQSFVTLQKGAHVVLQWKTEDREQASIIQVEKAMGEANFQGLANLQTNPLHQYQFVDQEPGSGEVRYRIQLVSADGTIFYSKIKTLQIEGVAALPQCYPNPFEQRFQIDLSDWTGQTGQVKIYNSDGGLMHWGTWVAGTEVYEVGKTRRWPKGVYRVQLQTAFAQHQLQVVKP